MGSLTSYVEKSSKWVFQIGLGSLFIGMVILFLFHNNDLGQLFGSLFLNLGMTIIVVNVFISDINVKVFSKSMGEHFRSILGIENVNSKLLPEIMNLTRGGGYVVLSSIEDDQFYYEKDKNKKLNMGIIETVSTKIVAKEDNVHYFFKRTADNGGRSIEILKLAINGKEISASDPDEFTIRRCPDYNYYIFERPLMKGKEYDISFQLKVPETMSDLNYMGEDSLSEDWVMSFFIQLTNKCTLNLHFPEGFPIENYKFRARRQDLSKLTYLPIAISKAKLKVSVSQENLDAGDRIWFFYEKKS